LQHSFEFVPEDGGKTDPDPDKALHYVQRDEHDRQVRDMQRQLSKLLAENLEINEMVCVCVLCLVGLPLTLLRLAEKDLYRGDRLLEG